MQIQDVDPSPFVTFYSYKGGVGRSMAVLNVSALLAARGFRVLIIDFDLEAPGLSHLIKISGKKKQISGVVELLSDAKECGENADIFSKAFSKIDSKYTFKYEIPSELKPHEDGELSIMPAGIMDESYSSRLNDLDLKGLYSEGVGKGLMLHFKKVISESGLYDYVVVDSRTGHSDEAGICTRDLADHLMVVTGFNRQNISGTASFLTNLRASHPSKASTKRKSPTIILSPVPIGEEVMLKSREDEAAEAFETAWGSPLRLNLFIPYHPRLALSEDAYVSARTASYLRDAYNDIESRLLTKLGHDPQYFLSWFRRLVKNGEGARALIKLKTFIKSTNSYTSKMRGYYGSRHMFDLRDNELLTQVLKLPEAKDILEIYVDAKPSTWELCQLGRHLHSLKSEWVSAMNNWILRSKDLDPDSLGNYAVFLDEEGYDYDIVKEFYKRAIKASPKHAPNLSNYSIFLVSDSRGYKSAEEFCKRAIKADPNHAYNYGNYGQFLLGQGRYEEGLSKLYSSWNLLGGVVDGNAAEFAYSIWLGTLLIGKEEKIWESAYKYILETGFDRHVWSFDAILNQVEKQIKPAEFKYAKALAEAFLDESKMLDLEKIARWKKIVVMNPNKIRLDSSVRGRKTGQKRKDPNDIR